MRFLYFVMFCACCALYLQQQTFPHEPGYWLLIGACAQFFVERITR